MNTRRRPNMRRLVDTTVKLVRSGDLSPELAASKLHESGVPVNVIGRVLGMANTEDETKVQVTEAVADRNTI
jgi:hypothetical protein